MGQHRGYRTRQTSGHCRGLQATAPDDLLREERARYRRRRRTHRPRIHPRPSRERRPPRNDAQLALPQPPRKPHRFLQPSLLLQPPTYLPLAALQRPTLRTQMGVRKRRRLRPRRYPNQPQRSRNHMRSHHRATAGPSHTNLSIGVVTLSMAQRTLIMDVLDAKRAEYPEIESFF